VNGPQQFFRTVNWKVLWETKLVLLWHCLQKHFCFLSISELDSRAAWLFKSDYHAHLVSKSVSVISSKSSSHGAAFTTQSRSSLTSYANQKKKAFYCTIMESKKSFAIMTAVCIASQWTMALCSKCCSIWKHVKIPHLITYFYSKLTS